MKIFLGYGLLLGIVGAGLRHGPGSDHHDLHQRDRALPDARDRAGHLPAQTSTTSTRFPTDIQPTTVLLVNVGAVAIAVLFSVLPALRAAMLHPVRALRYE